MSKLTAMPDDDSKWRAEADAHAMCEAEAIKKDPKRHKAAMEAAKRMQREKDEEAEAMRKVASGEKMDDDTWMKGRNAQEKMKGAK